MTTDSTIEERAEASSVAVWPAEASSTDEPSRTTQPKECRVTDTEHLLPWQQRQALRDKLATMPTGVDHDGHNDADRAADADRFARFTDAETPMVEVPPAQVGGMKLNPLQGSSGATVPAPAPSNPLEAVRRQLAKHTL